MTDDDTKFDVRVRERLLKSGALKDAEVAKHLGALRDVADQIATVVAKQPALQAESDRDIVIVRTSGVRPPPTPPRLDDDLESTPLEDDLDDDDDDLDDDDDDDLDETPEQKKKKADALEKEKADKAEKAEKAEKAAKAEKTEDAEESEGSDGEKKSVDDEWGDDA